MVRGSPLHGSDDDAALGHVEASLQSNTVVLVPMASTSEQSLPGLNHDPTPVAAVMSLTQREANGSTHTVVLPAAARLPRSVEKLVLCAGWR